MEFIVKTIKDLGIVIDEIISSLQLNKTFLLKGEMGVGKTTFVQQLLKKIEIKNLEGSPTYSIINNYFSEQYGNIYHLDLYRLNSSEEAFDIGIEEILYTDCIKFIEWPEKIMELIQDEYITLSFELNSDLSRTISIK
jgi:tRNA threonylcarbamoyladenosine biosynthesis protein TsaE